MNIQNYIFDFDGTIADTFDLTVNILKDQADSLGLNLPKDFDLAQLKHLSAQEILKQLKIPISRLPGIVAKVHKAMNASVNDIKIFPGIYELLKKLKSNNKNIYILSSNSLENIEMIIKNNKLNGFVDYIIGGVNLFGKAAKIKKLLKHKRLVLNESIYIGDEVRDITACKQVGILCIAITWGVTSKERLLQENPDYTVSLPREITLL